jgi:hypothetical protein
VLGEFFAARPEDIDEALVANGPYGRLTTVEAKGLSEVSLATLGEILGVGTYDDLVNRIAEGPQAESGEAGVLTIPSNLRDAFSGEADLDAAASLWVATDELSLDGWRKEDALDVLRELSELARTATTETRELWYWWSL